MARFVRGTTEGRQTELIFKAVARNKRAAKLNVAVSYFGRRPGKIPSLDEIEAGTIDTGIMKEYTVKVILSQNGDLKQILKGDSIAKRISENL